MKELIEQFPDQLREAVSISKSFRLNTEKSISNVVLCGLGGSGIGGEIIKEWSKNSSKIPVEVIHGYGLPAYVSNQTLVIVGSYSGNTEETLSCLNQAIDREAIIVGITSGGKLAQSLDNIRAQYISIPGGLPPRSALGYSLVQLARIFSELNLIEADVLEKIMSASKLIEDHQQKIIKSAEQILSNSKGLNLILYGEDSLAPILLRACQQLNENSKELAFYNVIPEMNHNEIVGWGANPGKFYTLFVRSQWENKRNEQRMDISHDIIAKKTDNIESVTAYGDNYIEKSFYLIHLFDWISYFKADSKGVDVTEVNVIDYLKSQLAEV